MATPYDNLYPSPWASFGVGLAQGVAGGIGSFANAYTAEKAKQEAYARQAAAAEAARRQAFALESMRQGGANSRTAATNDTRVKTTKMTQEGADTRTDKRIKSSEGVAADNIQAANTRAELSRDQRKELDRQRLAAEMARHYNSTISPETEITPEWAAAMDEARRSGDIDKMMELYAPLRNQSAANVRKKEARRNAIREKSAMSLKDYVDRLAAADAIKGGANEINAAKKAGPFDLSKDPDVVEVTKRAQGAIRARAEARARKDPAAEAAASEAIHQATVAYMRERMARGADKESVLKMGDAILNHLEAQPSLPEEDVAP